MRTYAARVFLEYPANGERYIPYAVRSRKTGEYSYHILGGTSNRADDATLTTSEVDLIAALRAGKRVRAENQTTKSQGAFAVDGRLGLVLRVQ